MFLPLLPPPFESFCTEVPFKAYSVYSSYSWCKIFKKKLGFNFLAPSILHTTRSKLLRISMILAQKSANVWKWHKITNCWIMAKILVWSQQNFVSFLFQSLEPVCRERKKWRQFIFKIVKWYKLKKLAWKWPIFENSAFTWKSSF